MTVIVKIIFPTNNIIVNIHLLSNIFQSIKINICLLILFEVRMQEYTIILYRYMTLKLIPRVFETSGKLFLS